MDLKGIDYFPFSIDFFDDNKIALIEAEFGSNGVLVLMKIYCKIYRKGFFCEWTPDDCMLFTRKMMTGMKPEEVQRVVDKALERGIFCKKSYESFGVLTSVEIQKQFFLIAARRKEIRIEKKDCLLIDLSTCKNICFEGQENLKPENVDISPENVDSAEQRKGKKRKDKEKKTTLTPFVPSAGGREQWEIWKSELLADEDWRASATRQSGQGIGFNALLPAKLNEFCDFIISCGEKESVKTQKDFVRRFHYWLSYHGMKKEAPAADKRMPRLSKIEEMNRVGDASLEIAKRILSGKCS